MKPQIQIIYCHIVMKRSKVDNTFLFFNCHTYIYIYTPVFSDSFP